MINGKQWFQLLQNPEAISHLYDSVPNLVEVDLVSVTLSRKGPSVSLHLNLRSYPDRPPSRWDPDMNRISIYLSFWGVKDFAAKGLRSEMKVNVDLKLGSNDELLAVIFNKATGEEIAFESMFGRIDRITPYLSE